MSVILVNKYMLRHKGVTYRPGDTVEMEDSMAEALAEQSAGAFSLVPSKKIASSASNEPPANNVTDKNYDAAGEDEASKNQADVSAVLAAADKKPPAKTTSAKRKTSAGAKK